MGVLQLVKATGGGSNGVHTYETLLTSVVDGMETARLSSPALVYVGGHVLPCGDAESLFIGY